MLDTAVFFCGYVFGEARHFFRKIQLVNLLRIYPEEAYVWMSFACLDALLIQDGGDEFCSTAQFM